METTSFRTVRILKFGEKAALRPIGNHSTNSYVGALEFVNCRINRHDWYQAMTQCSDLLPGLGSYLKCKTNDLREEFQSRKSNQITILDGRYVE